MHYSKHSRDELFQDFCLFGDDFIRHLLRQRQNAFHTIAKVRRHLIILVLFLQELNRGALLLPLHEKPVESTYLKRDIGNTEDSLRNLDSTIRRQFPARSMWKTNKLPLRKQRQLSLPCPPPFLLNRSSLGSIPQVILRVVGATSAELPPARTLLITGMGGGVMVRTVSFAENRTSREPLCLPMTTDSVLLNQICADWLVRMTDSLR